METVYLRFRSSDGTFDKTYKMPHSLLVTSLPTQGTLYSDPERRFPVTANVPLLNPDGCAVYVRDKSARLPSVFQIRAQSGWWCCDSGQTLSVTRRPAACVDARRLTYTRDPAATALLNDTFTYKLAVNCEVAAASTYVLPITSTPLPSDRVVPPLVPPIASCSTANIQVCVCVCCMSGARRYRLLWSLAAAESVHGAVVCRTPAAARACALSSVGPLRISMQVAGTINAVPTVVGAMNFFQIRSNWSIPDNAQDSVTFDVPDTFTVAQCVPSMLGTTHTALTRSTPSAGTTLVKNNTAGSRSPAFVADKGPRFFASWRSRYRIAVTIRNLRHTRAGDLSITLQRPIDNSNIVYLMNRRARARPGAGAGTYRRCWAPQSGERPAYLSRS